LHEKHHEIPKPKSHNTANQFSFFYILSFNFFLTQQSPTVLFAQNGNMLQ